MLGDAHFSKSKSPGISKNVLAIVSIIFDKGRPLADSLAKAAEPEKPPAKEAKAVSRKDRHMAHTSFGWAEVQAAGVDPTSTEHLSIADLTGAAQPWGTVARVRQLLSLICGND